MRNIPISKHIPTHALSLNMYFIPNMCLICWSIYEYSLSLNIHLLFLLSMIHSLATWRHYIRLTYLVHDELTRLIFIPKTWDMAPTLYSLLPLLIGANSFLFQVAYYLICHLCTEDWDFSVPAANISLNRLWALDDDPTMSSLSFNSNPIQQTCHT